MLFSLSKLYPTTKLFIIIFFNNVDCVFLEAYHIVYGWSE